MRRSRLPAVRVDRLFLSGDEENQLAPVVVGTDAWYDWLASAPVPSFSFQGQRGTFTARRERKRYGWSDDVPALAVLPCLKQVDKTQI